MKTSAPRVPTYDSMFAPTIQALKMLGGSATTDEIYEKVVQILELSDDVLELSHGDSSQTEVEYRLAWSRTYLKKYGLLQNSARGVWSLTSTTVRLEDIDPKEDSQESERDSQEVRAKETLN